MEFIDGIVVIVGIFYLMNLEFVVFWNKKDVYIVGRVKKIIWEKFESKLRIWKFFIKKLSLENGIVMIMIKLMWIFLNEVCKINVW